MLKLTKTKKIMSSDIQMEGCMWDKLTKKNSVLMASEKLLSRMVVNIKGNGKIAKCMDMEFLDGRMALIMMETINMVRNMEKESLDFQTKTNIKVFGRKASNTEKGLFLVKTAHKFNQEIGVTGNL